MSLKRDEITTIIVIANFFFMSNCSKCFTNVKGFIYEGNSIMKILLSLFRRQRNEGSGRVICSKSHS